MSIFAPRFIVFSRCIYLAFFVACAFVVTASHAYAADPVSPAAVLIESRTVNFNADWRFKRGDTPGFESPGYSVADWQTLDVPHDWSIGGEFDRKNPSGIQGGFLPMGKGSYRKEFVLPQDAKRSESKSASTACLRRRRGR